ncbi:MAG: methyltransferase domain-containing protein [Phycisphaerales bacterium]|nr:methyltransferase domain-containing protein [Phycisphaerales bacterium]
MDRDRYSSIAHAGMAYCNPISRVKAERMIELMELRPGETAIDIGCGKAELLIRLAERWRARGVGVDRSERFTEEARLRTAERGVADRVSVHTGDAEEFLKSSPGPYRAAVCVGSTHAVGSLGPAIERLARLVESGGWMLVGEGYWRVPPEKAYLEALGAAEGDYQTHAGNLGLIIGAGLVPLHACTASDDDWDEYEWGYARGIEKHVAEHPDDPDAEAMLARARGWRDIVARWGRDTLGFGLYLARVP